MTAHFDPAAVRHALSFLIRPGQIFELRILNGRIAHDRYASAFSGYFDNAESAVAALGTLSGWDGAYLTPNPVMPDLLARCHNRIDRAKRGESTKDTEILARTWILIDLDAVRPTGISSTNAEHDAAIAKAQAITAHLSAFGFPLPALGSSGNGAHLLLKCDLPTDSDLPKRLLTALAAQFDDNVIKVDPSVANPSRIWKLPGTMVCKGENMPDRPHRMATVLALPQLQTVAPETIAAYCDAMTANRAPATSIPIVHSPVNAVQLCADAGLQPENGHPHAGGGTTHPLGVCPCPRRLTDRSAFLSLPASGAIGLGCRHATCEYSDNNGRPGDHWKRFRLQCDPHAYDPPPVDAATAAIRAQQWSVSIGGAARAATSDGMDLGGIVDGAAAAAAPIPHVPQPTGTRGPDGRPQICTLIDTRDLRDQVLGVLQTAPAIYVSGEGLARIAGGARLSPIAGGALDSVCADLCEFIQWKRGQSGAWESKPSTIPVRVLTMMENLTVDQQQQFRNVDQITRAPFASPDGRIITENGYNAAARTLLVDCPEVSPKHFHAPDALAWLRDLLSDFPFESEAEASNYIGAMVSVVARPLIDGPMPMLLLEANTQGVGKSLLAQLIQVTFGLSAEVGPLPRDEKALAQLLLSILREAKAVHVFDNVKHAILSASLDVVLTSTVYTDRILGQSKSISCPVRQLWIATLNNGRLSSDMIRRVIRCRLRWDGPGKPEERDDVRRPNLLPWAKANRGEILSRLTQLVGDWMAAGQPIPADLPRMGGFESWSRVVGGIMRFAGDTTWMGNLRAAKEETAIDDGWDAFVAAWLLELPIDGQRTGALMSLALKHDLLIEIMGDGADGTKAAKLGRALSARRDSLIGGYRLTVTKDDRTKKPYFGLERVDPNAAQAMWGSTAQHS